MLLCIYIYTYIHNNNNKKGGKKQMKINKNFTLDYDLVEKLNKIDNSSRLVNDLLSDYFKVSITNNTIFEQKKAFLKQNKAKIKQINKEIKLLRLLDTLNFDQKCINWAFNKEFKYTEEDIDNYKHNRSLKISIENFKKCCEVVEKNGYLFKNKSNN